MEENTQSGAATPARKAGSLKLAIIILILLAAAAAGYWFYFIHNKPSTVADATATSTADIVLGTDRGTGPVATVNGVGIPRAEYEQSVVSIAENAKSQGADITDEAVQQQIKDQALTTLINTQLLAQAAANAGVAVTDDDVQNQYDNIVSQFGGQDGLTAQLASYNMTEDSLRADIKQQLAIQAYLQSSISTSTITVSEDEISSYYDSLKQTQTTLPDLEAVHDQIEQQLRSQKEQALVGDLLKGLRDKADIQTSV